MEKTPKRQKLRKILRNAIVILSVYCLISVCYLVISGPPAHFDLINKIIYYVLFGYAGLISIGFIAGAIYEHQHLKGKGDQS